MSMVSADYRVHRHDVIIGRGYKITQHNERNPLFQFLLKKHCHEYIDCTKERKSEILNEILQHIRNHSNGIGFLKHLPSSPIPYAVATNQQARTCISQFLRNEIPQNFKSSRQHKQQLRKEKKDKKQQATIAAVVRRPHVASLAPPAAPVVASSMNNTTTNMNMNVNVDTHRAAVKAGGGGTGGSTGMDATIGILVNSTAAAVPATSAPATDSAMNPRLASLVSTLFRASTNNHAPPPPPLPGLPLPTVPSQVAAAPLPQGVVMNPQAPSAPAAAPPPVVQPPTVSSQVAAAVTTVSTSAPLHQGGVMMNPQVPAAAAAAAAAGMVTSAQQQQQQPQQQQQQPQQQQMGQITVQQAMDALKTLLQQQQNVPSSSCCSSSPSSQGQGQGEGGNKSNQELFRLLEGSSTTGAPSPPLPPQPPQQQIQQVPSTANTSAALQNLVSNLGLVVPPAPASLSLQMASVPHQHQHQQQQQQQQQQIQASQNSGSADAADMMMMSAVVKSLTDPQGTNSNNGVIAAAAPAASAAAAAAPLLAPPPPVQIPAVAHQQQQQQQQQTQTQTQWSQNLGLVDALASLLDNPGGGSSSNNHSQELSSVLVGALATRNNNNENNKNGAPPQGATTVGGTATATTRTATGTNGGGGVAKKQRQQEGMTSRVTTSSSLPPPPPPSVHSRKEIPLQGLASLMGAAESNGINNAATVTAAANAAVDAAIAGLQMVPNTVPVLQQQQQQQQQQHGTCASYHPRVGPPAMISIPAQSPQQSTSTAGKDGDGGDGARLFNVLSSSLKPLVDANTNAPPTSSKIGVDRPRASFKNKANKKRKRIKTSCEASELKPSIVALERPQPFGTSQKASAVMASKGHPVVPAPSATATETDFSRALVGDFRSQEQHRGREGPKQLLPISIDDNLKPPQKNGTVNADSGIMKMNLATGTAASALTEEDTDSVSTFSSGILAKLRSSTAPEASHSQKKPPTSVNVETDGLIDKMRCGTRKKTSAFSDDDDDGVAAAARPDSPISLSSFGCPGSPFSFPSPERADSPLLGGYPAAWQHRSESPVVAPFSAEWLTSQPSSPIDQSFYDDERSKLSRKLVSASGIFARDTDIFTVSEKDSKTMI